VCVCVCVCVCGWLRFGCRIVIKQYPLFLHFTSLPTGLDQAHSSLPRHPGSLAGQSPVHAAKACTTSRVLTSRQHSLSTSSIASNEGKGASASLSNAEAVKADLMQLCTGSRLGLWHWRCRHQLLKTTAIQFIFFVEWLWFS
jgi:hypothetical protein